jgi:hypothetical protein
MCSVGNFLSISLQERIGLRNVLICLHWTDESLCEGKAGAGVFSDIQGIICLRLSCSRSLNPKYMRVLACLEYCISEGIVSRAVSICSDSRAALLALESYAASSRVVLQCIDSLQDLALSNKVRLVWVLRHCGCGIHGNDEADALARAVSSSAFVGPEHCLPLAPLSAKRREREWLHKSHSASWSLKTGCRQ